MLRGLFLLFFLLLLFLEAASAEPFIKLSSPLFKAAQTLESAPLPKELQESVRLYIAAANAAKLTATNLQKQESVNRIKSYLLELRKLQKKYDYTLHRIHMAIDRAVKSGDYERFISLVSIELDGLLHNRAIQERSLAFYALHKSEKRSPFLEQLQADLILFEESNQEVFNEVTQLEFDSRRSAQNRKNSVYVTTKEQAKFLLVYFHNSNDYGVTLSVTPQYINLKEYLKHDAIFSLKPKEQKLFAKLSLTQDEGRYGFRYSWILGEMGALHDSHHIYRLPFKRGASYRVSQGHNTDKTHKGRSQYAIDFSMPIGTKIYAAREGVVVRSKSDSNSGGYDRSFAKDGNFITIAHSDGTFATYYHLMQNGVLVRNGEHVEKGSHIGYSGNTGYSSGPHLHFAVFTTTSARTTQTIAVRFSSSEGVFKTPIQGQFYTAN